MSSTSEEARRSLPSRLSDFRFPCSAPAGVRRERCSYRGTRRRGGLQPRSLVRVGPGSRAQRHLHLEAPLARPPQRGHEHSSMSPEEFIYRIMEAEPPEIYLMEDLKKPFTEASMMMSLTNLADKELVFMISWAKKIPGEDPGRASRHSKSQPRLLTAWYCASSITVATPGCRRLILMGSAASCG